MKRRANKQVIKLKNLKQLLSYASEKYGEAEAYSFYDLSDKKITVSFSQFQSDITAFGAFLFSHGIKGHNTALLGENCYELIVALFSCAIGSTAVMLDKSLSQDELKQKALFSDCEYIICTKKYIEYAKYISEYCNIKRIFCLEDFDNIIKNGELILKGDNSYKEYEPENDSVAIIAFTSGTTGESKGVPLTHSNLMSDALSACENVFAYGCTVLSLPLNHTFAITVNIIVPIYYGMCVHICSSLRYLQRDIKDTDATAAVFVPLMVENIHKQILYQAKKKGKEKSLRRAIKTCGILLKHGIDIRKRLFSDVLNEFGGKLRLIICGGAPLSSTVVSDLCSMGIELLNGYGINECSPVVSVNKNHMNIHGSAGKILSCNEVKISAQGEILVRGSNVIKGYYKDNEATNAAFTSDGWFKTGDLGYINKDGYLFITGRIKNLIIMSNGENVSPEELEAKLFEIPFVKEAVVLEDEGIIAAEIYSDNDTAEHRAVIGEAVKELNSTNPAYKKIEDIRFRDEPFKKTTTMKIKRDYRTVRRN